MEKQQEKAAKRIQRKQDKLNPTSDDDSSDDDLAFEMDDDSHLDRMPIDLDGDSDKGRNSNDVSQPVHSKE